MSYAEAGQGAPVVLIHGALVTCDDMVIGLFDHLAPRFRVVAVDRPGHGDSLRHRFTDASPSRQAAMIREAVAALGIRRPMLVGHSFGGAVALAYAIEYPDDVAGVVALAPICFPEPRLEQSLFGPRAWPLSGDALAGTVGVAADTVVLPVLWRSMFLPQAMPARFAAEFPFAVASRPAQMVATGEDAMSLFPALTRQAFTYSTCRRPVDILAGDADAVVNPLLHGRIAAGLLPHATFRSLPGCGHMAHHFHGEEIAAAIARLTDAPR